jgi:hypothetical protein
MAEKIEYRASSVDIRKAPGGAMLFIHTDMGEVVVHLTEPAFQNLAHQTKHEQSRAKEQLAHPSDNHD